MRAGRRLDRYLVATFTGVAFGVHIFFTTSGRINGDEGAYLNWARLVAAGEVPYRDFAFTQMPLLPYIHALPQTIFGPSLLVGRLTSLLFAFATIGLGVDAARRSEGAHAGAIAGLLFAAFTLGAYMNSITKTHAIASFFLVASLWVLMHVSDDAIRLPVATGLTSLATLTRLSCVVFALVVFVVGVRNQTARRRTILFAALPFAVAIMFVATDLEAARWGLSEFHYAQWATTGAGRLAEIVTDRLPRLLIILGPLTVLVFLASRRRSPGERTAQALWIYGVATLAFVALHLWTGQWHDEYMVPLVAVAIPLVGIVLARRSIPWRVVGTVAVAATMVAQGMRFVHRSALTDAAVVSDLVAEHSETGETIFALGALWAAVDADRSVPRGFELLSDGIIAGPRAKARRLHVVTPEMLIETISGGRVPVVVVTPVDRFEIWRTGGPKSLESFEAALLAKYRTIGAFEGVGQPLGTTTVYALKASRDP